MSIPAIVLGRRGSKGFPGKNTAPVRGKPISQHTIEKVLSVSQITGVTLSTDDPDLKALGCSLGIDIIDRPAHLCTDDALGEDAFLHAYRQILRTSDDQVDALALFFCNAPIFKPSDVDSAISILRTDTTIDSVVSVSKYNMWSPTRARRIKNGLLEPFIPFDRYSDQIDALSCDRDSQGDVYFADMGFSIVRPSCLENLHSGTPPQKWMGTKIFPYVQEGGFDIDYSWQLPQLEHLI